MELYLICQLLKHSGYNINVGDTEFNVQHIQTKEGEYGIPRLADKILKVK